MKNYELISKLVALPAGYDIVCCGSVTKKEMDEDDGYISKDVNCTDDNKDSKTIILFWQ